MTPTETTPSDVVPTEVTSAEVAHAESSPTEVTPTEITPTEVAHAEAPPTEVASSEVLSTEAATEISSTEAPSSEVVPAEVAPPAEVPTDVPAEAASVEVSAAAVPTEVAPTEVPLTKTTPTVKWHREFARVISCTHCTRSMDPYLLRDSGENVPQPGYVGANYDEHRVLIIGQNPGARNKRPPKEDPGYKKDREYVKALRTLRDEPTIGHYREVAAILNDYIPQFTIHSYFVLDQCGLTLDDIAYFNLVRCRTQDNHEPRKVISDACSEHFTRWLRLLQPRAIVFIGLLVQRRSAALADAERIPHTAINRSRYLSTEERDENQREVVRFVRRHLSLPPPRRPLTPRLKPRLEWSRRMDFDDSRVMTMLKDLKDAHKKPMSKGYLVLEHAGMMHEGDKATCGDIRNAANAVISGFNNGYFRFWFERHILK
jgi:uracil-DNA glycosylase